MQVYFHINEINDYFGKFPLFRTNKELLDNEKTELVEFTLPHEWQKQLLV